MTGGARRAGIATAWLGLGANLGNRTGALRRLRDGLAGTPGISIAAESPQLLTRPVGVLDQPDFLNQVIRCRARPALDPADWLELCRRVEAGAGRRPTYRWGPRRADADILLLGSRGQVRAESAELRVPHPELAHRPFLCALLALLEPALRHPDGWRFADRAAGFRALLRGGQMGSRSAS